ncbi:MAG: selenocysteine protein, partial [Calditrichia bacterium]|nr:selenocysteine protein [Calditrichia bacterium]
ILKHLKFRAHVDCKIQQFHPQHEGWNHYLKEHVYHHIFKKHIIKIFFWTLIAIWLIHVMNHFIDLKQFVKSYPIVLLLIASLVGLIPESGPHIFFISLFAAGTIPFSVLLANSISQDGHGVLPLISMCIKDTIIIKALNVIYAFIFGLIFYSLGF